MRISEDGQKVLAQIEGVKRNVYNDVAGLPTIGVGHLLTKDELSSGKITIQGQPVKYGNGLTDQQVMDLLSQDLTRFNKAVSDSVTVPLEQHQFDALVSFTFNIGVGAFKSSTLLKRLNAGEYNDVPAQLHRWIYAGSKKVTGLINRRDKEAELWLA